MMQSPTTELISPLRRGGIRGTGAASFVVDGFKERVYVLPPDPAESQLSIL